MELDWLYDDDYSAPAYTPPQGYAPTFDMNPTNGLPMVPGGGFDVAGNVFGMSDVG